MFVVLCFTYTSYVQLISILFKYMQITE